MAGTSLFALLDDITALLDDISVMTKVAAQKTSGIVGDDLAVTADQLVGIDPKRELPIVAKVAAGSLVNKAILIPAALIISAFAPFAITPLLMVGGVYLCYEGVEKIAHKRKPLADPALDAKDIIKDIKVHEKEKVFGAIRTDFILSAEIVVIALGTMATATLAQQAIVLSAIGLGMTVGVYGIVAGLVKLDDLGLHLAQKKSAVSQKIGRGLLAAAPKIMKTLSVVGTAAMFMVGGGILMHGLPGGEALTHGIEQALGGGLLAGAAGLAVSTVAGLAAGACALFGVSRLQKVFSRREKPPGKKPAEAMVKSVQTSISASKNKTAGLKQQLSTASAPENGEKPAPEKLSPKTERRPK